MSDTPRREDDPNLRRLMQISRANELAGVAESVVQAAHDNLVAIRPDGTNTAQILELLRQYHVARDMSGTLRRAAHTSQAELEDIERGRRTE